MREYFPKESEMDEKAVFNAAVCAIGIAIFLLHIIDLLVKKNKRKDEKNLLAFIFFTAVHFSIYLAFASLKIANGTLSEGAIMAFYTVFYICNNVEMLLLFAYTISYIGAKKKTYDITFAINISVFSLFVILDVANLFGHFFFFVNGQGNYERTSLMFLSQGYQLLAFITVFVLTAFNRKLGPTEKIAFTVYCLFPLVAIIIQNLIPGYAIAYISIILATETLFVFANVRRNMEMAKREREAEIKIMMSQIQPHFIYNTLSSISTLIKIDPDKAQKGLDNFTEYLRSNLASLTDTGLILFSDELRHIKTYLELEKMRFNERLTVTYDIQAKDFLVPPLSIQPLVENAVKHGILRKVKGGSVCIKTHEEKNSYVVEILDNGVGFDTSKTMGKEHIGMANVRTRLNSMCRADLRVESEMGKGTTMTVVFYK